MPGPISDRYWAKAPNLFRVFMDVEEVQVTIAALEREIERAIKSGDAETQLICRSARDAVFVGASFNPQSSSNGDNRGSQRAPSAS